MNRTPLSEPRDSASPTTREEPVRSGIFGRLWDRIKSGFKSLIGRDHAAVQDSQETQSGMLTPSSAKLPARRRTTVSSADNRRRPRETQQELVSTRTGDELTLTVADNPDASISSDTWEPVER